MVIRIFFKRNVYIGCAKDDMGFVLKVDGRDDNMRLADINWAIQMGVNLCKELTETRLKCHTCTSSYEVAE